MVNSTGKKGKGRIVIKKKQIPAMDIFYDQVKFNLFFADQVRFSSASGAKQN